IKNGPLEPIQVAGLGHEIASGLSEAHTNGIIHRDLKVENVIVTPKGHAKILDFGLARPLLKSELDTSLTGKGQLVGTSRTMSPEYVSGEDIDHRSDLFSLGVLLYEAATSHSPFKAHNTLATLKQVMLHQQTPAHLINPNVPEELSDVIELLLEKDPGDRPQTAQEVAEEFGRISGQISSSGVDRPPMSSSFTTTPTEVFTPSATAVDLWVRRRWLPALGALLAAGILATYLLTRWWLTGPDDLPTPKMASQSATIRVVLANFQNHTGDPLLDDSLETAFRLGLEQSRYASVLPRSHIEGALARMERPADTLVDRDLGIEIGQREGAQALVIGSIGEIGEVFSLSAEIIDPQLGTTTYATNANAGDASEIVKALERVTKDIRLNLGESLAAIEQNRQPLERVTTKNLEALKAYSLGSTAVVETNYEAASQLLERALEIDPEFAMAHARLATVYLYSGVGSEKVLEHLSKALEQSNRLTEIEKLYVEGWVARLRNDTKEVIRAWSLMSTLYPNEFSGQYNLGMAYWIYLEQYQNAANAFEAAARVAGPDELPRALNQLSHCQIALGLYDEALANIERISGPQKGLALADLFLVTERYSEARLLLAESTDSETPRFYQLQGQLRLAELNAAKGNLKEALKEATEARKLAVELGMNEYELASRVSEAVIQERLAPEDVFLATLEQAARTAVELIESGQETLGASLVPVMALLGKLQARHGRIEEAKKLYDSILSLQGETVPASWQAQAMMLEGELLAAEGDLEGSVERLEESSAVIGSFQAHESLARIYREAGRTEASIAGYKWLIERRGLGLVECSDLCHTLSTIDWHLAFYHLGKLHQYLGDEATAAEYYSQFIGYWNEGAGLPAFEDANSRIATLGETG
ncbi:MAG: protein kinase, partial [Acidobacteriota bacterium]